jgi:hypothetical protein
MLATVRHLHGAAIDDALLLFDALMTTKLLARAERLSTTEKLRTLPRFRKAAGVVAGVLAALKDVAEAEADAELAAQAEADAELAAQAEADGITAERVFLSQAWEQIEQVAGREELAKALETVVELVPDADEDGDAAWRAQLVARYPTVRGDAFAHYGRMFKTLHVLQFLHDQTYRRTINTQLNMTESRHALARRFQRALSHRSP